MNDDEPLGISDIAARMNVSSGTVRSWHKRGKLPDPDGFLSRRWPWWWRSTINRWKGQR